VSLAHPPRSSPLAQPQLADQAEGDDEPTAAERIGRKSLGATDGTSPRVSIRVAAELQARASAARGKVRRSPSGGASARGTNTVIEIAREALERYAK
jgi:hypothetical protein